MNVSDIMARVKRQFGDESGVQVTDADIIRWVNDGMRHIVLNNEGLLEVTALSNSVINQQDYSLPVDLVVLRAISFKPSGQDSFFKLKGISFAEFNERVDGWDGTAFGTSTPSIYTQFAGKVLLFPIPDESISNAIKIFYNRKPTDVVATSDTPELPVLYHQSLVDYCLKQAYEMDEDWEAAAQKQGDVTSLIQLLRGRDDGWKNQETYPIITVLEEDL